MTALRAFRLAYDGTGYHGFQRQPRPDVPTVEDALFDALRALDVLEGGASKPPGYAAAGRTDAGVSALAQTVAFESPAWLSPAALNGELTDDVRAWASAEAPEGFHATHDARSRTYAYHLYAPEADDEAARAALDRLVGAHDFHNLTPDAGDTTRTIREATVERDGPYLLVTVRADGFLRQQVRRIVSIVRSVARGDRALGFVDRALSTEELPGPEGIASADPRPLVLLDVEYLGLTFGSDPDAAASARRAFEERRIDRLTGSRVAGRIAGGISGREG